MRNGRQTIDDRAIRALRRQRFGAPYRMLRVATGDDDDPRAARGAAHAA